MITPHHPELHSGKVIYTIGLRTLYLVEKDGQEWYCIHHYSESEIKLLPLTKEVKDLINNYLTAQQLMRSLLFPAAPIVA